MRIQAYNQNKELISEKEIQCIVPKCVQEFDDSHPLVYISSREHKLLNSKTESSEKLLLIDKFRHILQYDYSLYLDSENGSNISFRLSEGLTSHSYIPGLPQSIEDVISDRYYWLIGLIDYVKDIAEERFRDPIQMAIWLKYIKSESKDSWSTFFSNVSVVDLSNLNDKDLENPHDLENDTEIWGNAKRYRTLLSILRNEIYPMLKKKSAYSIRLKSILHLIPSHYSSCLQPYSFEDDKFVISLCNALYETKSKRRSDLYGVVLTYNYMSQTIVNPSVEYIRRIDSPEYVFVFDDKNGSVKIEVAKEEYASILVGYKDGNTNISIIKDFLQERYEEYSSKEHSYIEEQINSQVYNEFGAMLQGGNTKKWREFYRITRQKYDEDSKISERSNPSYYYNLLFAINDNPYKDFEINEKFTTELLIICNKFHGIRINEIFDNIYCLNYIKKYLRDDEIVDDPFIVYPNGIESNSIEDMFRRIMDFLAPILKNKQITQGKWINGDDRHNFRLRFIKLLEQKDDDNSGHVKFLRETLIKNIPYKSETHPGFIQGFNIRLLCNIIGALTSEKDKTQRVFCEHTATTIIKKLCVNRNIPGSGSYRNYINGYNKFGTTNTLLNKDIVTYIQRIFKVTLSFN